MFAENSAFVYNLNSLNPSDSATASARSSSKPPIPSPCRSGSTATFSMSRCDGWGDHLNQRNRPTTLFQKIDDVFGHDLFIIRRHGLGFSTDHRNPLGVGRSRDFTNGPWRLRTSLA